MRNNIKLLTDEQLTALKQKYSFSYKDGSVVVSIIGYNRVTKHPCTTSFSINSTVRKVTFTVEAIDIWRRLNFEWSLLDVQQAVNTLTVCYQLITLQSVKRMLQSNMELQKQINSNEGD